MVATVGAPGTHLCSAHLRGCARLPPRLPSTGALLLRAGCRGPNETQMRIINLLFQVSSMCKCL